MVPQKMKKRFPGFTLIELVVVITILAILATIGFLSVGGYSSKARDSSRVADVSQISKSLDLSIISAGSYPMPDNAFFVTYSGGTVWKQGTIGNNVLQQLHTSISGGGLGKKPTDPLKWGDYTYASLAEGKAYQIKAEYEGDVSGIASRLFDIAYAAPGAPTVAYVRGNFGGLVAKTSTGGFTYVLAVPSILTNTWAAAGTFVPANSLSGTLLFNGKPLTGASAYNPSIVVFSGAKLPADDTAGQLTNMASALKSAYSGSDIASHSAISTLLNTASGSLGNFGTTVLNPQLGGMASSSGGGSSGTGSSSTNPTALSMNQSTRSRTFTVSWTAGSGNGGAAGCRIEYQKNDNSWVGVLTPTTTNCDVNAVSTAVTLPTSASWQSSTANWNGRGVRLVRISDSAALGTLGTLACATTTGSASSTPDIDEDCNGTWDNTGSASVSGCASGNKCMQYYTAPWDSFYQCYYPPTATGTYSCQASATASDICVWNCGTCNDGDTNVGNRWRDAVSTNCSYSQTVYN